MTITTDPSGLSVILHGREQVWALRANIIVPIETISDIRYAAMFEDWRKWEVRMPGASIPGRLLAGSFWTEVGWDFLYITNPRGFIKPKVDNVLVIETNQNRYCRIIISVSPEEASGVIRWWQKSGL